jgi:5-methyltetrahydrofolate--homocysteine methyltransferase
MNPLHAEEMTAVMGANVMLGKDKDCRRWLKHFREPTAAAAERGERRRRRA